MPSPEQIGAWLDGFGGTWFVPLRPREPWERAWFERPRLAGQRISPRGFFLLLALLTGVVTTAMGSAAVIYHDRFAGAMAVFLALPMVLSVLLAIAGPATLGHEEPSKPPAVERKRGRQRVRLVANSATLSVHGAGTHCCLPWTSLVRVETVDGETLLHWSGGDVTRLPDDQGLDTVINVARRIMAARAEQDDALQACMERGLSRPDDDQRADRGISLAAAEEPAERDQRSMPGG